MVEWDIPDPKLGLPGIFETTGDVGLNTWRLPGRPESENLVSNWAVGPSPMYINFSDPMVKNIDKDKWDDTWVVYPTEEHVVNKWVYLVITGMKTSNFKIQVQAAHPVSAPPSNHPYQENIPLSLHKLSRKQTGISNIVAG